MAQARFLQFHTLTSYAASLLNRDDAGFAKRIPFGGAVRTRVSSQCLKRHWRVFDGDMSLRSLKAPESIRSRIAFEKFIVEPLLQQGLDETAVRAVTEKLVGKVFGSEKKEEKAEKQAKKKGKKEVTDGATEVATESAASVATAQVTVLGKPELDYLCELVKKACTGASDKAAAVKALEETFKNEKALKANLQALKPGSLEAGLGAALFGRMVTGDILARTDAAIHVAHAMTVHGQFAESDYFSAIDDLLREEGEQGSGHINASELTSGLFYGYVVVDVRGLLSNLGNDAELAGSVIQSLTHMLATVSPGAKLGSTAPYAYSHLLMVEAGRAQPRTLANAFLEPVETRGNVVTNAYGAMKEHLAELDAMYGQAAGDERVHAGLGTKEFFGAPARSLADVAQWARERVKA